MDQGELTTIPETDDKGRTHVKRMTDREHLEEQTAILRATQDLIEGFLTDFKAGKIGGPLGMLGKFMG